MALRQTLQTMNGKIQAEHDYQSATPERVELWRAELTALYGRISEFLKQEIADGLLGIEQEDRDDKQLDLGGFETIDLYMTVKGQKVVRFEAKANKADGHAGLVEVSRLGGKGVGKLTRIANGLNGQSEWTIAAAQDRNMLSRQATNWLSRDIFEASLDLILRS